MAAWNSRLRRANVLTVTQGYTHRRESIHKNSQLNKVVPKITLELSAASLHHLITNV